MCPFRSSRRRGALTPFLLFAFMLLLAIFGLAVNNARMWTVRAELQRAADAGCLAALQELVDDDLLRGNPQALPALLARSRDEGRLYASFNMVDGTRFNLHANDNNDPDGDIVHGTNDPPVLSKSITPASDVNNTSNASLAAVNSVHVTAKLTRARGNAPHVVLVPFSSLNAMDVRAVSTAVLDRDVIGFRHATAQPLPIAPFALLSDPQALDLKSWQYQVESTNGADQYRYDRFNKVFVADPLGDGLREFDAVLALDNSQMASANVAVLFIGTTSMSAVTSQLASGVTAGDLTGFGGKLALQANNRLDVPGSALGPADPSLDLTALYQELESLRLQAAVRIWPLYSGFNGSNPSLSGFVAARVVRVDPVAANQPLRFKLQPTMISSPSALTNAAQRGINGVPLVNPYICKLRFVE